MLIVFLLLGLVFSHLHLQNMYFAFIDFCFAPLIRCLSVENHIPPDDPAWCHEHTSESSVQCCEEDFCNTKDNYAGPLPGENNKKPNCSILLELVLPTTTTKILNCMKSSIETNNKKNNYGIQVKADV